MMTDEKVVYLSAIEVPPTGWVPVPADLAHTVPGLVAYFTWPISSYALDKALKYPNSETAKKIRALSF